MKKLISLLFILNFFLIQSQQEFTINGYVLDSQSNELVIGSSVIIEELQVGTVTNSYGFFSITLDEGEYTLKV